MAESAEPQTLSVVLSDANDDAQAAFRASALRAFAFRESLSGAEMLKIIRAVRAAVPQQSHIRT